MPIAYRCLYDVIIGILSAQIFRLKLEKLLGFFHSIVTYTGPILEDGLFETP